MLRWVYFVRNITLLVNIEKCIEHALEMIRRGYRKGRIIATLEEKGCDAEESYEVARCRINAKGKFSVEGLFFDRYGLRYSTPEIIGRYRAKRIRGRSIADLSCGVGLQAIFYSFTNREVLGIDISERRIRYAELNARAYGAKNIRFIVGDCLSDEIVRIAGDYEILFSDPARKESEEERKLETLLPPPPKIIERYGTDKNYVFDLPPQISLDKIPGNWEKEFISVEGRITRFTVYVGDIKVHDRVAVSLPSGASFWSDAPLGRGYYNNIEIKSDVLRDFIYVIDESLYYAHLLREFAEARGVTYIQVGRRRTLGTGDLLRDPFLRPFRVLCTSPSLDDVTKCLRDNGIGKVTLRFRVPPGDYWKIRGEIEKNLRGEKKGSIFRLGDMWVGTENVT